MQNRNVRYSGACCNGRYVSVELWLDRRVAWRPGQARPQELTAWESARLPGDGAACAAESGLRAGKSGGERRRAAERGREEKETGAGT